MTAFAGIATSEEVAEAGESMQSPILPTGKDAEEARESVRSPILAAAHGKRGLYAAVLGVAALLLVGAASVRGGLLRSVASTAQTQGPVQTLGLSEEKDSKTSGSRPFLLVSGDSKRSKDGLICMGTKTTYGDQAIMLLCDPAYAPQLRFDRGRLKMEDDCVVQDGQDRGKLIVQKCGSGLGPKWSWKDGQIVVKDAGKASMCLNFADDGLSLRGCVTDSEASQRFLQVQPSQLSCSKPKGHRYTRCQLAEKDDQTGSFFLVGGDAKASSRGLMCMGTKASYRNRALMILCDPDSSARLRFRAGHLRLGDECVTGDARAGGKVTVQKCGLGSMQEWTWKAGHIVLGASAAGKKSLCLTWARYSLSVRRCAGSDEATQRFLQVQPSQLACSKPKGHRFVRCQTK